MELFELTELQQVLQEYANDAVEIYKYQIALGGKYGNKGDECAIDAIKMAKF